LQFSSRSGQTSQLNFEHVLNNTRTLIVYNATYYPYLEPKIQTVSRTHLIPCALQHVKAASYFGPAVVLPRAFVAAPLPPEQTKSASWTFTKQYYSPKEIYV